MSSEILDLKAFGRWLFAMRPQTEHELVMLAGNLLPLVGIYLLHWRVLDILVVYFAEWCLVGVLSFSKFCLVQIGHRLETGERVIDRLDDVVPVLIFGLATFVLLFGIATMGLFSLIGYLAVERGGLAPWILFLFLDATNEAAEASAIVQAALLANLWGAAGIGVAHLRSFWAHYLKGSAYRDLRADKLSLRLMWRLAGAFGVTLVAGILVQGFGALDSACALTLVALVKSIADQIAHRYEHL